MVIRQTRQRVFNQTNQAGLPPDEGARKYNFYLASDPAVLDEIRTRVAVPRSVQKKIAAMQLARH